MMAKWLLTAALFSGLTATLSAATPPAQQMAPVCVDIFGRLHVKGVRDDGSNDGRCLPPPRTYEIEADGQRFNINIGRFADQADRMDGQLVLVTGTLNLDTVNVRGLFQEHRETRPALRQYVRVTIEGQLSVVPRDFPPYDSFGGVLWSIQSGNQTFGVRFADAKVEVEAARVKGSTVIITGELKGGHIVIDTVEAEIPIRCYPMPSVRPEQLERLSR
jgi:hypothetical protein